MSYNNYLSGELDSLSDDRRTIEYDNGDRARWLAAVLNPFQDSSKYSREGLRSRAAELERKNINKSQPVLDAQTLIQQSLGGTNIDTSDLTIGTNETAGAFNQRLAGLKGLGAAVSVYGGIENSNLGLIKPGTTVQQINKLTTDLKASNKQADEVEQETIYQQRREEGKSDARDLLTAQESRQDYLLEQSNLREDRKDARRELTRAEERKDALELRRDNMNLEYARLSQADKYKAQDRKDKAVMMLLQGLGNLGAGFTI